LIGLDEIAEITPGEIRLVSGQQSR
jgi:hypothetical protein